MPNPVLRQNKAYETITDAIASKYGIAIKQQVYIQDLNLASFDIPQTPVARDGSGAAARRFRAAGGLRAVQPAAKSAVLAQRSRLHRWRQRRAVGLLAHPLRRGLGRHAGRSQRVDRGGRYGRAHQPRGADGAGDQPGGGAAQRALRRGEQRQGAGRQRRTRDVHRRADRRRKATTRAPSPVSAPHCRVLPVKVSNDGYATSPDSIAGWLLAKSLGAKVINFSFGGYDYHPRRGTGGQSARCRGRAVRHRGG